MAESARARENFRTTDKNDAAKDDKKPLVNLCDKDSRKILLGDKKGKEHKPKADHLEPKNLFETMVDCLDSSQKSWSNLLDKEIKKNAVSKDPLKQTLAVLQGATKAAVPTLLDSAKFTYKIFADATKEDQKDHGPLKAGTLANGVAADVIAVGNAVGEIGQGLSALAKGAGDVAKLAVDGTLGQKISDSWNKKNLGERAELATVILLGAASDDPRKKAKVVEELVEDTVEAAGKKKVSSFFEKWGNMDELDKNVKLIRRFPMEMKQIADAIKKSSFKDVVIDSVDDIKPGGMESLIVDIPGDYMLKITKGRTGIDGLKGNEDWMLPIKDAKLESVYIDIGNNKKQQYHLYLQRKAEPISADEVRAKVKDKNGDYVEKHPELARQYDRLLSQLKQAGREFVDDNYSDQLGIIIDPKTNKPLLRFMDLGAVMTEQEHEFWVKMNSGNGMY